MGGQERRLAYFAILSIANCARAVRDESFQSVHLDVARFSESATISTVNGLILCAAHCTARQGADNCTAAAFDSTTKTCKVGSVTAAAKQGTNMTAHLTKGNEAENGI